MRDYLELAPAPIKEKCEQVGPNCDYVRMKKECRTFIKQLVRQFGEEPEGAYLSLKSNPHDFGTYYEVVCYYDDDCPESVDYAFKLEGGLPEHWDDEAKKELGLDKQAVEDDPKVYLRRVRINSYGYDSSGRYYGTGRPVYTAFCDDWDYDWDFRADDRNHAKSIVLEKYPNATFYN